jgi:hypothetical protein
MTTPTMPDETLPPPLRATDRSMSTTSSSRQRGTGWGTTDEERGCQHEQAQQKEPTPYDGGSNAQADVDDI